MAILVGVYGAFIFIGVLTARGKARIKVGLSALLITMVALGISDATSSLNAVIAMSFPVGVFGVVNGWREIRHDTHTP